MDLTVLGKCLEGIVAFLVGFFLPEIINLVRQLLNEIGITLRNNSLGSFIGNAGSSFIQFVKEMLVNIWWTVRGWFEIPFWRFAIYLLKSGYGYCEERDGNTFMSKERCAGCDASDVQDWIEQHIKLIKT